MKKPIYKSTEMISTVVLAIVSLFGLNIVESEVAAGVGAIAVIVATANNLYKRYLRGDLFIK